MRKLLLGLLLIGGISIKAQDVSKVFSDGEVVWFGLDFTKAKFVGQFAQASNNAVKEGVEMRDKYIPGWQSLIAGDQKKFNIAETFRKDNVFFDMGYIDAENKKINVDECMVYNPGKLDKNTVGEMVKNYTGQKKDGLGLTFVIENFNKTGEVANFYVVFFDIATKKVLLCEYMTVIPRGIGIRNYWAGAIKEALIQIDGGEYKRWKKAAGVK